MNLVGERVRMELTKTFKQADNPARFFRVLDEAGQLVDTFPELHALKDVPAGPQEHHQEGDAFEHTLLVIEEMQKIRPNDSIALLMSMSHDLGKQKTPVGDWPHHHGHGQAGLPIIDSLKRRLSLSNRQTRAMKEAAEQHMRLKHAPEMRDATLFDIHQRVRNESRLIDLMVADARGREPQGEFNADVVRSAFSRAATACEQVTGQTLIDQGRDPEEIGGEKFGKLLRDSRISRMKEIEEQL